MLNSFFKWPKLVISAVYEAIAEKAKKANTTVKNYIGDDTSIDHISAVVYDILPLAVKLSYRYDRFNKAFHENFKILRDKIYSYEDSLNENMEIKKEVTDYMAEISKKAASVAKNDKVATAKEEKKTVAKKTVAKKKPTVTKVAQTEAQELKAVDKEEKSKKVVAKKKVASKAQKVEEVLDEEDTKTLSKPAARTAANKRAKEQE